MHTSSYFLLFILTFECCIFVMYVIFDYSHSVWNFIINKGVREIDSKLDNNQHTKQKCRAFLENATMVCGEKLSTGDVKNDYSEGSKGDKNMKPVLSEKSTGNNFETVRDAGMEGPRLRGGGVRMIDKFRNKYNATHMHSDGEKSDQRTDGYSQVEILTGHFLVCPTPYGRIGNMLFQYAASVGIAHELKYKHVIEPSHTLLQYFQIKNVHHGEIANKLTVYEDQWTNETWRYNDTHLTHNLTLFGYFQSWKYFHNFSDEIRSSLTIKPKYLEKARTFLKYNVPGFRYRIGIHVRRGDFLTEVSIEEGRVVADKHYIEKAMDYYRKKYEDVFFVVLSDEMKWCRENIKGDDVIYSKFEEPIVDLAIMSLCDHMIITVGSFSWWGGWLSGGMVVYLKDFPRNGSSLDRGFIVREEYYYPDWIGMSNG